MALYLSPQLSLLQLVLVRNSCTNGGASRVDACPRRRYAITLPTEITAAALVIQFWNKDINVAVWITSTCSTLCCQDGVASRIGERQDVPRSQSLAPIRILLFLAY